jgi:hypothetical protein
MNIRRVPQERSSAVKRLLLWPTVPFQNQRKIYSASKAQGLLYVPTDLTQKILRSAHTVYLCVLCGSEDKQWLFHYTALTDWLVF